MGSSPKFWRLHKKTPQVIAIAIAIAVILYFVLDFLDDVVMEGNPVTSEPIISLIITITRGVTSTVRTFGYPGIFGLMLLESSSVPIPSEVILPFAGYLSFLGQLDVWMILVAATAAGLLGSLIDYYIGLKGAESLIKHKVWGRIMLSATQLEAAQKWFDKHGSLMVFVSRMIPGFRTTFSFPAGATRMPLKKFIAYTTAGSFLWSVVLVYLGGYLGANWTAVAAVSRYVLVAAVIVAVVVIAAYLLWKRKDTRKTMGDDKSSS